MSRQVAVLSSRLRYSRPSLELLPCFHRLHEPRSSCIHIGGYPYLPWHCHPHLVGEKYGGCARLCGMEEAEGVFKIVKWGQWPDTTLLPLRRGSFPSYEGCDMYHSIEKSIDSLPLIFNTFMSFCLLHTKCKLSCLKQIIYHIPFCLPESHLFKFLNRRILLNLYVRDTESRCKNTNFIVNKRIMPVIFLISFSKNLHFF